MNKTDLIEPGYHYAAEYLRALARHLRGCRGARDPEHVHQARVACRRIRAGLRVAKSSLPVHKEKRWRKQLRCLAGQLSQARDLDVQLVFLRSVRTTLPQDCPRVRWGVNRLLLRWKQRRGILQDQIRSTVDDFLASDVLNQMQECFRESDRGPVGSESGHAQIVSRARTDILDRLRDMCQYQSSLKDLEQADLHHRMRIAAKKFRYTMEIYSPVLEQDLHDSIRQVKTIQELLGQIHDCDVWLSTLVEFIPEEQQRIREHFGHLRSYPKLVLGFEYFQELCRRRRNELFEQMQSLWEQQTQECFWEQLAETLASPVDSPCPSFPPNPEVYHGSRKRKEE